MKRALLLTDVATAQALLESPWEPDILKPLLDPFFGTLPKPETLCPKPNPPPPTPKALPEPTYRPEIPKALLCGSPPIHLVEALVLRRSGARGYEFRV